MSNEVQRVLVASSNPVKINAARVGFTEMFPDVTFKVEGQAVPSGVADQPMSVAETLRGAINRANAVHQLAPEVDYAVGIEGGLEADGEDLMAFAWVVVRRQNRMGRARTGSFVLPREVADLVRGGLELGDADEQFWGKPNTKQSSGSVGLLTEGVMDRAGFYSPGVILALIPFKQPALDFGSV